MQDICSEKKSSGFVLDSIVILFGTFFLLNGILWVAAEPLHKIVCWLPGGLTPMNQFFVQQVLQAIILFGWLFFFLYGVRKKTLRQIGLRSMNDSRWGTRSIGLGIAVCFLLWAVSIALAWLFPDWMRPQAVSTILTKADGWWETMEAVIAVSILAPFSEELLFRGYLYHSFPDTTAVSYRMWMTSILFGCMHYDLFRLLPLTLVGYFLNWIFIQADSLWASILAHGTWNLCMVAVLLWV